MFHEEFSGKNCPATPTSIIPEFGSSAMTLDSNLAYSLRININGKYL